MRRLPRISRINWRAMISPRPLPSMPELSRPSRSKGWNRRASCSRLSPGPLSSIRSTQQPPLPASSAQRSTPPSRLYLTPLDSTFSSTWRRPLRVGVHAHAPGHLAAQLDAARPRERARQLERLLQRLVQPQRRDRQRQPALLDLLQVEHVVDQRQQVLAGREDVLAVLAELVAVVAALQAAAAG
jgi:hypothetical protein